MAVNSKFRILDGGGTGLDGGGGVLPLNGGEGVPPLDWGEGGSPIPPIFESPVKDPKN